MAMGEGQRTAQALSESETGFRQIAEHIDAVFLLIDHDSAKVHYVSPAYEAIWGRSCASLYSQPHSWIDCIHPDDRDLVASVFAASSAAGSGFDLEHRVVHPDRSIRWIHLRGFPVFDTSGKPHRTAAVATDISEARRAAEELRESNRRFKDLLDDVALISVMFDLDARVTYCNDYFLQLTGWKWE